MKKNGVKEQEIKQQVIDKLKGFSPNILQEKIPNKTDSFFYEGDIAEIEKPNGTILTLIATGEIRIEINGKTYKNNQVDDAISEHKLTDKKLQELGGKGKIDWLENNWFEVVWQTKGNDYADSDIGVVAGDYDEAIELLKSYYEDDIY
jgi:hypothetical protein